MLHGVVALALVMLALTIALSIGGPTVGRDELYRMNPALELMVGGAIVPFPLGALAALFFGSESPRRAWTVPLLGIAASILLWGFGLLFLHAPEPLHGG